jgi:hypothetical protein
VHNCLYKKCRTTYKCSAGLARQIFPSLSENTRLSAESHRIFWESIEYKDGVLSVSADDGESSISYELFENGEFRYAEKGNGNYFVNYDVDDGNVTWITITGNGMACDGEPFVVKQTGTYRYNEHRDLTAHQSTYSESSCGETKKTESHNEYVYEYEQNGNRVSYAKSTSNRASTYEYAPFTALIIRCCLTTKILLFRINLYKREGLDASRLSEKYSCRRLSGY